MCVERSCCNALVTTSRGAATEGIASDLIELCSVLMQHKIEVGKNFQELRITYYIYTGGATPGNTKRYHFV